MRSKTRFFTVCCFILVAVLLVSFAPASASAASIPDAKTIFTPSEADDARHTTDGTVYEWWYLDAAFDNGYSMSTAWEVLAPGFVKENITRRIRFSIYDPSGKEISMEDVFAEKDTSASTTTCDVKMGTNRLNGNIKRYTVEFRNKVLGCKLTFDTLGDGFRFPPGGISYFSKNPDKWIGWTIAQPKATVTGTLFLNGKEIRVKGIGYHDHNWGNIALSEMYNYWYWGRLFLKDYTLIYSVGEMSDALGKKPTSIIFTYKGSKLVDITSDITATPKDFVQDKFTGAKYPQSLVLNVAGKNCSGTVTHKINHIVEKTLPFNAKEGEGHAYFRFLSDAEINLNVAGDKIILKDQLLHELMIP